MDSLLCYTVVRQPLPPPVSFPSDEVRRHRCYRETPQEKCLGFRVQTGEEVLAHLGVSYFFAITGKAMTNIIAAMTNHTVTTIMMRPICATPLL